MKIDALERAHVRTKLNTGGWEPVASSQIDVYFCAASFVEENRTKECPYIVRIRTQNDRAKIAYKSFTGDGSWVEIESGVENPDAVKEILTRIGQRAYLTIRKARLSGHVGGIEVNLDEIDGLGTFIEMELVSSDVEAARAALLVCATELGLSTKNIVTEGYVQLMEAVK